MGHGLHGRAQKYYDYLQGYGWHWKSGKRSPKHGGHWLFHDGFRLYRIRCKRTAVRVEWFPTCKCLWSIPYGAFDLNKHPCFVFERPSLVEEFKPSAPLSDSMREAAQKFVEIAMGPWRRGELAEPGMQG